MPQEEDQIPHVDVAYQASFSAGELAPALHYRSDLAKWRSGAAAMTNLFVQVQGNVSRRPGTQYVGGCTNAASLAWRLIPFQFNLAQQYILEMNTGVLAIIYQGAFLMNGDGSRYTVATPYASAELTTLRFVQSADVLTIVHPNHPPMQLSRLAALNWTLTALPSNDTLGQVPSVGVVANTGSFGTTTPPATVTFSYAVSAVSTAQHNEGPLSPPTTVQNHDTSYYDQYGVYNQVSWIGVAGADSYKVYRYYEGVWAFVGSTVALTFQDTGVSPNTAIGPPGGTSPFAVQPIVSIAITAPGGGYSSNTYVQVTDSTGRGAFLQPLIVSGGISGIQVVSGGFGYTAPTITIHDPGGPVAGSTSTTTGSGATATATVGTALNFPGVVGYFQERIIFGGSNLYPETIWTSKSGNYNNFDVSNPTVDDDAITVTLAARQINQIKHFVPLGDLIVMTAGGGWRVDGSKGAITPGNFDLAPQTFPGVADVEPIPVGNYILMVEAKGSSVREIIYNLYANSYVSEDISVFANHLLLGHTIVAWAYADTPHKVVWMVRDDGVLLSLTYLKEQEIFAWAQHTTAGLFKAVAVVSEPVFGGVEDVPYFVITDPDGSNPCTVRMRSLQLGPANTDPTQAWYVDRGVQYAGAPVSILGGLSHLEGRQVQGLANGVPFVATVSGGAVPLPQPSSIATAGLSYTSSLTTLPLTTPQAAPGVRKHINLVRIMVTQTAGVVLTTAGGEPGMTFIGAAGDDPDDPNSPVAPNTLVTGIQELYAPEGWDRLAQVTLQTSAPLPANISGMMVEFGAGF